MNANSPWTRARVLVPVMAGLLALAGCGGSAPATETAAPAAEAQPASAPAAVPNTAQPATTTPPPATDTPVAAPVAAPAAEAAPVAAPAAAAASAMVQEHETGVEVTLVELKRTSGDSVTLRWRYRNTTGADVKLTTGGSSWYDPYRLTAESFLIDPVNKKKYLVITDNERIPLTSKHGDWKGVSLAPDQTLSAWAKFPAPPAGVDTLTVTIAGVPPFEDVPVVK